MRSPALGMTARRGPIERAARGREATDSVLRELRQGAMDRDLSEAEVGGGPRHLGLAIQSDRTWAGPMARVSSGLRSCSPPSASISRSECSSGNRTARDTDMPRCIDRFRRNSLGRSRSGPRCHSPSPVICEPGTSCSPAAGWRHGYEAETRPTDLQALERRIELKARDGEVDGVSLLLIDSRHNREFVRANPEALARRTVPGAGDSRRFRRLRAGARSWSGAVILL